MRIGLAGTLLALSLATAGAAQSADRVGKVGFPNSCSPAVQEKLLRGIAMLHSFYYSATQRAFEEVAAEDPSCAIAAWGYASILMSNPLQGIGASPKAAQQAQAAIDKGRQMGAKTERERDYLEAGGALLEKLPSPARRARPPSPRTSSPASATGQMRRRPTAARRTLRRGAATRTTRCTRWTT